MNKRAARKIADTITNSELKVMFDRAKTEIENWEAVSSVNPGMTKGTAWNILHGGFNENKNIPMLAKTNMVWEFGDFLDEEIRAKGLPRRRQQPDYVHHEEPKF